MSNTWGVEKMTLTLHDGISHESVPGSPGMHRAVYRYTLCLYLDDETCVEFQLTRPQIFHNERHR